MKLVIILACVVILLFALLVVYEILKTIDLKEKEKTKTGKNIFYSSKEYYIVTSERGIAPNGSDIASKVGRTIEWNSYFNNPDNPGVPTNFLNLPTVENIPLRRDDSTDRVFLVKESNGNKKIKIIKEVSWRYFLGPQQDMIFEKILYRISDATFSEIEEFVEGSLTLANNPLTKSSMYLSRIQSSFHGLKSPEKTVFELVPQYLAFDKNGNFKTYMSKFITRQSSGGNPLKKDKFILEHRFSYAFEVAIRAVASRDNISEKDFNFIIAPFETVFGKIT